MKGLAIRNCSFCGKQNIRKGHEKKCVERLRRAIAPKRAKQVMVDEWHGIDCGSDEGSPVIADKILASDPVARALVDFPAAQSKRIQRHALPDLTSNTGGEKLRQEFKAKFPAAHDVCPHCQAAGFSMKHQDGCPNGESRSVNETYVPESAMPAIHWRSVYYIKIKEGPQAIPVGTWIVRGGIDRGDRSEADLERDGWVRADGRFAKTALEFPKTPGRVPDLYPRFQPGDAWYVEGADNMIPIYWGDHA